MSDFNLGAALQSYKENSEITVLSKGPYTFEVTSATAGKAAKGPTITPVLKLLSGPQAGARVMVGKMSFAETALWKTIPQVKGFGITEDFMLQANSMPDPVKALADAMVGRVIEAVVDVDNWEGQDRNKLVSVRPPDAGFSAPVPPTQPPAPPTPAPLPTPPAPAPNPQAPAAHQTQF